MTKRDESPFAKPIYYSVVKVHVRAQLTLLPSPTGPLYETNHCGAQL